jgi:hypothetical protein
MNMSMNLMLLIITGLVLLDVIIQCFRWWEDRQARKLQEVGLGNMNSVFTALKNLEASIQRRLLETMGKMNEVLVADQKFLEQLLNMERERIMASLPVKKRRRS